jgi:hypothetical protein
MSAILVQSSLDESSHPVIEYGTLSLAEDNADPGVQMERGAYRLSRDNSAVSSAPPSPQWRGSMADLEEQHAPNHALIGLAVGGYFAVGCVYYAYATQWGWLDSVYFTMQTVTTVGASVVSPLTKGLGV